jgi:hypothetical protein
MTGSDDINRELAEDVADCFTFNVQYTAIPETQTLLWRDGMADSINHAATAMHDFREGKDREALIALGWTPPDGLREVYLAGYQSGFHSAGNYFSEQSWQRYKERK